MTYLQKDSFRRKDYHEKKESPGRSQCELEDLLFPWKSDKLSDPYSSNKNTTGDVRINVTLRRFHIVVEKQ